MAPLSRLRLLGAAVAGGLAVPGLAVAAAAPSGALSARPRSGPRPAMHPGLLRLGDTILYVPKGYAAGRPHPLVLALHGAGGDAAEGLSLLRPYADRLGLLLVAPTAANGTWDLIQGGYGADVRRIDAALAAVFRAFDVDPARVAVAGFSDGGSYALALGIGNGALFRAVAAFSPGFLDVRRQQGAPRVFVSHGTQDRILPIGKASRAIVRRLRRAGYRVRYREFFGGHELPSALAGEAARWLVTGR